MSTPPRAKAAIYIKEAAGYPNGENFKELQLHHCEEFCQYHDLNQSQGGMRIWRGCQWPQENHLLRAGG